MNYFITFFFMHIAVLNFYFRFSNGNKIVMRVGGSPETKRLERSKRQALRMDNEPRWPRGTINYFFDEQRFGKTSNSGIFSYSFSDENSRATVLRAMEKISNHTCIKFSPKDARIKLRIVSDKGCQAAIGRVGGDQQYLSFPTSCYSVGSASELIHVIGFLHSHQRADRDEYLKLNLQPWRLNDWFQTMQYKKYLDQWWIVPYDYGSIMQYHDSE